MGQKHSRFAPPLEAEGPFENIQRQRRLAPIAASEDGKNRKGGGEGSGPRQEMLLPGGGGIDRHELAVDRAEFGIERRQTSPAGGQGFTERA